MKTNDKNNYDEALLKFFHNIILDNEQKRILTMIFKGYDVEDIIKELIDFRDESQTSAEI